MTSVILSGYDSPMAKIGDLTRSELERYGELVRVPVFVMRDDNYRKDSHPSWQKILFVLEYLSRYDVVYWFDADTVITRPDADLPVAPQDVHGLVCSEDWGQGDQDQPSLGNFACGQASPPLWVAAMRKTQWKNSHLWEQSAIREVRPEYPDLVTIVPGFGTVPTDIQNGSRFPWTKDSFLAHLTGVDNERRVEWFKQWKAGAK